MSTTPITNLGSVISNGGDPSQGAYQQDAPSVQSQPAQAAPTPQAQSQPAPTQSGSRLARIIGAVANVAQTALAGIPDQGRPSFVTGLGQGARAEQAAQATQQAIKFKDFE